jgi:hypothetical protein
MAPGLPGIWTEAAHGRVSAKGIQAIQARLPESRVGFDGVEEEDVMFDDEKLAAHQEILEDHNYDQGWAVHGPAVQKPKPVNEKTGPAPGVLQVDSAEPQVLVDGIASAVGHVVGEAATAGVVLDLNGRPLQANATESTNPKVRQAIDRMAACREQYKTLTPEQLAEENNDINRRLSQKYRTECNLPTSGGTVSKSYYYDSKTIERLELDIKQVLLESSVPRSTVIEICRLRDPEDQRQIIFDILDKNLSCREARQIVQLIVKTRSRSGSDLNDHLTPKLANLLRHHAPYFVRLV